MKDFAEFMNYQEVHSIVDMLPETSEKVYFREAEDSKFGEPGISTKKLFAVDHDGDKMDRSLLK